MLFVKSFRFLPKALDTMIYPERNTITIFSEAKEAFVEKTIYPGAYGRIKCHGVFYRAKLYGTSTPILCVGRRVRMIGICENVALVTDWIL